MIHNVDLDVCKILGVQQTFPQHLQPPHPIAFRSCMKNDKPVLSGHVIVMLVLYPNEVNFLDIKRYIGCLQKRFPRPDKASALLFNLPEQATTYLNKCTRVKGDNWVLLKVSADQKMTFTGNKCFELMNVKNVAPTHIFVVNNFNS